MKVISERPNMTLPVSNRDGLYLDPQTALDLGGQWQATYAKAQPFPHIVFDQFLPEAVIEDALAQFPQEVHRNDYQAASQHI